MAEGLDGAAQAFHTEINPQARPRDDGGRFSSSARPETMFEERPVEGDPKTGDTRDGGEDARLASRERRIADGWLDERADRETQSRSRNASAETERESGQRRVGSDGAQRHDAAANARHAGAEAEPERIGEQEPDDQDAQGADKAGERDAGDGEGTSEQDAEGGKWEVSLDGKPVEKLEVIVDGQPHTVTLDEVVRGFVDGETYQKRVAQVGQAVEVIQGQFAQATQLRDQLIQQLQNHEEEYAALLPKEPNWDEFHSKDPQQAWTTRKNYEAAVNTLIGIRQRRMQMEQMRADENARRTAEYANNGWEQFKRNARIADQATLNNEVTAMRRAGQEYGFGEQELATVYDPRMLAVLHDASKYRRMVANKPRPVTPDKGRTLAPGNARPIGSAVRRGIDDLQSKLAKTGKLDDAAALFQRLIK
jgi:hypothetical protein